VGSDDQGHGHDHDHHSHDHDHSHGHAHHHSHEPRARPGLERGAGAGKLLFFDCFSGVAGDMTIAALVDLGVPKQVVIDAVSALPIAGYELVFEHVHRSQIVATRFDVRIAGKQPQRSYGAIDKMIAASELDAATKSRARAIFRRLGLAEAHSHRVPLEDVHFHEVGAVDAIVDVVGAAAALAWIDAEVVVSPLPIGRGFVRAQHGVLPLPAPATVTCLAGAPTYEVAIDEELVTPTGAAIVAASAARYSRWPSMAPMAVGYGGGTKEFTDRPNLLRVVLGEPSAVDSSDEASHVVLEANVDDMTGELASHAISQLMTAGALDAWAQPITMKKGRPGLVIAALSHRANADAVAAALLRETTSIGLRKTPVSRAERPRRIVAVTTRFGPVPVKISEGEFGPPQAKPEFDACAALAAEHGVPVRVVLQAALAALDS
jgi:pyridinium-3,5-bisthiocarboxylic acid mononucleotide nickel chelatase